MPRGTDAITASLQDLYARFINFLPNFIVAVVILVVGWILANFIAKLIKSLLVSIKLDEVGDKLGLEQIAQRTGMKMSISGAIAWLIKWFFLIALFLAASDILGLQAISNFLNEVLLYIPNVVAAAAILLAGILIARFLSRLVRSTVAAAGLASADLLGSVTQWAIIVFTALATLAQLNVAEAFVQTLFTGFIAMIAIAGGLAFGLGGKEHASKVLDKIEKDIRS
ncbi:MAG: mechanosensitive ion channel family protein [Candidatus Saccharibacteria bacterium]